MFEIMGLRGSRQLVVWAPQQCLWSINSSTKHH